VPRVLTSETSVDYLRKEAKIWLKALRAGQPDARTRLVAAWPEAPDSPGLRDIQYALAREYGVPGWIELKEAAADQHKSPREQALQALLKAADTGDAAAVESILANHPGIVDERGTLTGHTGLRTALHFGVHSEAVVRALLARGANPNIRDEGDNAFPLHFAAENGNLEIVRLLVEHGAQTVAGEVDDHQMDIIGWATCFAKIHPEVVDYLLAHGARHTLHSAVAVSNVEAIRALAVEQPEAIERPMDKSNRRRRALHFAVIKRQPTALRALLDLGADPNGLDAGGLSPLDEAALAEEHEMAQMLIDAGAKLTLASAVALGRSDDAARLLREEPEALKPGGRWGTLIGRDHRAADSARRERERARNARDVCRRDHVVHGASRGRVPRESRGRGGAAPKRSRHADPRQPLYRDTRRLGAVRRPVRDLRASARSRPRYFRRDLLRSPRTDRRDPASRSWRTEPSVSNLPS
jgi:ankyrin repeat protein